MVQALLCDSDVLVEPNAGSLKILQDASFSVAPDALSV